MAGADYTARVAPGEYDDETEISRASAARPLRCQPELSWSDEEGAHRVTLAGRTVLGAAPAAEVRISDREVSRLHAELEPTDRGT